MSWRVDKFNRFTHLFLYNQKDILVYTYTLFLDVYTYIVFVFINLNRWHMKFEPSLVEFVTFPSFFHHGWNSPSETPLTSLGICAWTFFIWICTAKRSLVNWGDISLTCAKRKSLPSRVYVFCFFQKWPELFDVLLMFCNTPIFQPKKHYLQKHPQKIIPKSTIIEKSSIKSFGVSLASFLFVAGTDQPWCSSTCLYTSRYCCGEGRSVEAHNNRLLFGDQ